MQAQNYHWSYNFQNYDSNFPIIGEVYINGEVLASSDFEIAAFVGDQVRATEFLFEADPISYPGHYFAWLGVSYNNAGETVTFKLYDHSTGTEHDNCSTTMLTNGYGEIDDPVIIEFTVETPISYGPDYPWVPGNYENFMYMETQIQIDGIPVTNTNWEVGAFCGDECRGLGDADNWWESPVDNSDILEIMVGGATGEVISFYLYDVTNQEVYPAICAVTLEWIDDDIGDMFEPFVLNFETSQTFTKEIAGYNEGSNDHYYLIASPIGEVNPSAVQNMLSNNYDLYYFDQSAYAEWINHKDVNDGGYNLVSGKGYLYANSEGVTLIFTGNPYDGDGQVTLDKDADSNYPGWNLVGNPFAQTAYITMPFYVMNPDGSELISSSDNSIEAMEAVFVVAENDGDILTFSTTEPTRKVAALVMNVTHNRGTAIDRAIVRFDDGGVLPKFQLNENNTKLYIPEEGKDYAVVNANASMGEMPVSFKAENDGTYTMSFSSEEVSFNYLHLIDNMAGKDVDLLATSSYTFDARITDYANRFKLVFALGTTGIEENFAFFSNGNLIINGEGTLQIIDVMGRVIVSRDGVHTVSTNGMTAGVYVLRLINGDDVKVQKIVVE